MTNQSRSSMNEQPPPPLSKRQRRAQGPNPSNTWQQQPRIKSAGARARAYVSYAGLADDDERKPSSSSSAGDDDRRGRGRPADLLDPRLDLHSPEVKFGRLLGGTDQRSRHRAVRMLREYLRARSDITSGAGLSEMDLLKLWKGLWYTLYMADKTPVQDKLSKILAELMWCLSGTEEEDEYAGQVYCQMTDDTYDDDAGLYEDGDGDTMEIIEMEEGSEDGETNDDGEGGTDGEENEYSMEEDEDGEDEDDGGENGDDDGQRIKDMNEKHCRGAHLVSLYVSTFLQTVRREWGNVDKHRVDKFYTAVRFMVSEVYKYMSKRCWNIGIVRLFNDVLYEEGLSADTPGLTNGLRYHLIDICIDELAKVNKDAELPLTEATILDCLEPFFGLAQKAADKNVQRRVMDKVMLKFLNEHSFVCPIAMMDVTGEEQEEEQEAKALIFNQVHVGTVAKFIFDIASNNNTDERFRKSLYEMHKTFVRQIRVAGRDVDLNQYLDDEEQEEADLDDDGGEGEKCIDSQHGEKEKSNEQDVGAVSANAESDNADDITNSVTKYEHTQEKKKKRKKKKNKVKKEPAKELDGAASETPKKPSKEEHLNAATPVKSSSKKKRKNNKVTTGVGPTSEDKTLHTPKEKKQKSPPSVNPRSMHSPDQVASPPSSDNETRNANASASKRVMFKAMNHCKSHKASMKAVKALEKEQWDTKTRTPEKSILRPKGSKSSEKGNSSLGKSSSKKRGRRHT